MTTLTIEAALSRRRHFDPNAEWIGADMNVAVKWLILAHIMSSRLPPTDQDLQAHDPIDPTA